MDIFLNFNYQGVSGFLSITVHPTTGKYWVYKYNYVLKSIKN